jgi:hypothetical protein
MVEITEVIVLFLQSLQQVVDLDHLRQETDPVVDLGVEQILNLAHLVGQGLRTKDMVEATEEAIQVIIIFLVVEAVLAEQAPLVEQVIMLGTVALVFLLV